MSNIIEKKLKELGRISLWGEYPYCKPKPLNINCKCDVVYVNEE